MYDTNGVQTVTYKYTFC